MCLDPQVAAAGARTTVHPGKSFAKVELPWSAFDGSDGSDVMGILLASTAPGKCELVVDDVEIR